MKRKKKHKQNSMEHLHHSWKKKKKQPNSLCSLSLEMKQDQKHNLVQKQNKKKIIIHLTHVHQSGGGLPAP